MTGRTGALRVWSAVTAAVSLAAVVLQLALVLTGVRPDFVPADSSVSSGRAVVQFFSYFTIESNLLVVLTCIRLALRPARPTGVWRVLRLAAVVGITVTGLVYGVLLGPYLTYFGLNAVANAGLHYATPALAVLGYLLLEPRGWVDASVVGRALLWPAAYVVWILAYGAATSWYPYPFIDVTRLGYPVALRNGVGLAVLIALVALGAWALDRRVGRSHRPDHERQHHGRGDQ